MLAQLIDFLCRQQSLYTFCLVFLCNCGKSSCQTSALFDKHQPVNRALQQPVAKYTYTTTEMARYCTLCCAAHLVAHTTALSLRIYQHPVINHMPCQVTTTCLPESMIGMTTIKHSKNQLATIRTAKNLHHQHSMKPTGLLTVNIGWNWFNSISLEKLKQPTLSTHVISYC